MAAGGLGVGGAVAEPAPLPVREGGSLSEAMLLGLPRALPEAEPLLSPEAEPVAPLLPLLVG